ncbi:MAG: long-chain-fatty-acid--CoA ligase [Syntrophales bacterium]|jgi:acyl-CoA synthetase (AMP-forming)/AMP-acid ligase II|nr:long-chain-fatty-acid--CoA ligase [Syntrophales bacterium]
MILADSLKKAYKFFPNKKAVVCGDNSWTYEEFFIRLNNFSRYLKTEGIKKGDRIAILHPNCHYYLESYYALAIIGATAVPLNHRLSAAELSFILNDAGARLLIASPRFRKTIEQLRGNVPSLEGIIWTGETPTEDGDKSYEEIIAGQYPAFAEVETTENDIAQIYYTSGTTGRPKGVILTHKNVSVHALGTIAELQLTDRDVWLHAAPLFHLADAWASWAITWVGGTHVLVSDFDPAAVLAALEKERVTLTNLIPTMLNILINYPEVKNYDFSSLRVLLSGGASIAPEVVRRIVETFGCDYLQTYGMTETSPYLTLSLLKEHLRKLSPEEQLRYKSKTGREFIAVELKVVNEEGRDIRQDEQETGEIIVRGDTVTPGYWHLPEETQKAIRDGWLYTGDMAVMDSEGYVTIVDRKKDMIVTGGENVYSTEVENILYQHHAVLECAVVGVPDEKWGETVHAVVVLKPNMPATPEELIDFCKERIAHYKSPKSVEFLPELPKTGSGKIEKKKLRDKHWPDIMKKI